MIGIEQAKSTLLATTQYYVRSAILPISRRYRTDRYFYRNRLDSTFAADLYYGRCSSGRGYKYCFIIAHPNGFCVAYPQKTRTSDETTASLNLFIRQWGVPDRLIVDGAQEMIGLNTSFVRKLRSLNIDLHVSEARTPQQNPAEGIIREVRKKWSRIKTKKKVHERLWDYAIIWICELMRHTVSFSKYAERRTPIEMITGDTPDISEYLDFSFYDWVIFKENTIIGETVLGRFLGVSHSFGNMLTYYVIKKNGEIFSRSTVQRVTSQIFLLRSIGSLSSCSLYVPLSYLFCLIRPNSSNEHAVTTLLCITGIYTLCYFVLLFVMWIRDVLWKTCFVEGILR